MNDDKKKLTVCYFGTYTPEYSRNRILISGIKENGVDVIECQTIRKGLMKYVDLIIKHWKIRNKYDVMIVGFQGVQAVILAKFLTRKTIIFDAFASLYDSMILDRRNFKPKSLVAIYYWWLDKISMTLADVILFDTNENINFVAKEFRIKKQKFKRIFVGASTDVFYPIKKIEHPEKFKVLFYGSFLPLHGIEYIIRSAKTLEKENDIVFEVLGWGPEKEKIVELFNSLKPRNLFFTGGTDRELLRDKIVEADVCLGIFGNTSKAKRVIPNKVYECLAVGKPVITADTPAIRELFEDGELMFVSVADHASLAKAIMALKNDVSLSRDIAKKGHQKFLNFATPNILGNKLLEIINEKL
ncbi:MAG: glycosyltransferase [Patescibacteria group bacterium]